MGFSRTYRALLGIRNASWLQRFCLAHLARTNISPGEIVSHDFADSYPRISLASGTRLSAPDDLRIGTIPGFHLPDSHNGCLAAYLLRYRFGHAFAELIPDTSPWPRGWYPSVLHRQHLNTLQDLPSDVRSDFIDEIPIRPGDHVLEVGSYIGFGTTRLSQRVGDTGSVVSIEADPEANFLLRANVRQNDLGNVETHRFAVSGEDISEARFYRSGKQANSLHHEIVDTEDYDTVEVRSLATVLAGLSRPPTFIVLTINGAELEALQSASDLLRSARNLRLVVPGWYRDTDGRLGERIVALLESLDFRVAHTRGMQLFAYRA